MSFRAPMPSGSASIEANTEHRAASLGGVPQGELGTCCGLRDVNHGVRFANGVFRRSKDNAIACLMREAAGIAPVLAIHGFEFGSTVHERFLKQQ